MMLHFSRSRGRRSSYPLEEVKKAIQRGAYWITRRAGLDAAELYLDEDDIKCCVLGLEERHFLKTMPSKSRPGLSQDVYRCRFFSFPIYVKLQIGRRGQAVVISFKRDDSA